MTVIAKKVLEVVSVQELDTCYIGNRVWKINRYTFYLHYTLYIFTLYMLLSLQCKESYLSSYKNVIWFLYLYFSSRAVQVYSVRSKTTEITVLDYRVEMLHVVDIKTEARFYQGTCL